MRAEMEELKWTALTTAFGFKRTDNHYERRHSPYIIIAGQSGANALISISSRKLQPII